MGTLTNTDTRQCIQLRDHHIVGRHPETAHTLIKSNAASRSHCLIEWQQDTWFLQDISANGTYINGKRLAKNIKHPLHLNDQIQFGLLSDSPWQVSDLKAPSAFLKSTNPKINDIPLTTQINLLANGDQEQMISQTLSGQWLLEHQGNIKAINNGDIIHHATHPFILISASQIDATQECQSNIDHAIKVHFNVSLDEEHVSVLLDINGQHIDLEDRTHHYLVLLLARKYQEDIQNGIPHTDAGWLDKSLLMKQTRLEETHINTQFYRFRKQLHTAAKKLKLDIDIIDRRRGEIRVQCSEISIKQAKAA